MVLFAVSTLVLILILLTHFINWVWRQSYDDDDTTFLAGVATFVYIVSTMIIIRYIIIWGQALIK